MAKYKFICYSNATHTHNYMCYCSVCPDCGSKGFSKKIPESTKELKMVKN